ncbi:CU044_5270 family protein [Actinophytocola sp.]|uniref:CU044_5270 family protein n=1 Tax=Actinophytocola sp. TaxID=1872138 RepID=UPI002ED6A436
MTDHDPIDELLADLHTDVPRMSDRAFGAGRTRLQALVAPVGVTTEPKQSTTVAPLRPRRSWRSPPRLIASAAAVVALVVGGVLVVSFGDNAPSAAAVAQLNSAADEIDTTDVPLGPGQYRYVASHAWNLSTVVSADRPGESGSRDAAHYLMEELRELWVPADPKQECTQRSTITGNFKWVAGDKSKGAETLVPSSSEGTIPCGDVADGGWQQPSTKFLASLPRDPDALYDRLRADAEDHGQDPDMEVLVYFADVLRSGQVPADLRAALYRALAKLPGLEITEQLVNLDGHQGTAFGMSVDGDRHDVIIDRTTGDFIGERQIDEVGKSGVPAGTVISYSSVANPVVVGAVGATS